MARIFAPGVNMAGELTPASSLSFPPCASRSGVIVDRDGSRVGVVSISILLTPIPTATIT
ncbi:hypothetical protein I7I53_03693 [Histoplasma capsulatum var. duboisii H88]|uniref:Uncharacterized protein n=1 Tax=Ajellomyces capsulatus (strain H88) TaxID=544711 RepID=A0A8A1LTI5_AJEC8|nr:hypothetical protein I7I53_03693 [Histoplasma capsulatum var. duboisii H88]